MKRLIPVAVVTVMILASSSFAQKDIRISASPVMAWNFGQTEYVMELAGLLDGDTVVLKSQLEFPVNVMMAGGKLEIQWYRRDQPDLTFAGRILTNVNDPGGSMLDRDWKNGIEKSHTESDVGLSFMMIDLQLDKRVTGDSNWTFSLLGGFKYQRISQDIVGLEGWQLPFYQDTGVVPFWFSLSYPVGTYLITYNLPHIGAVHRYQGENLWVETKAAYTRIFLSDRDDHLLRNFVGKSSGQGNGFIGHVQMQYDFEVPGFDDRAFVGIMGEFLTLRADLTETRAWYDNDPIDDDGGLIDNTGDVLSGIPHEIRSTQFSIGVRAGFTFR